MHMISKTLDIDRINKATKMDELLKPYLADGFDVKATTKDMIILTKQVSQ